jgi:hypothetical protein
MVRPASDRADTIRPPQSRHKGVRQADGRIAPEPTVDVNEVGEAVAHMTNLPLSINVLSLTIMATKMPFVGPGWYNLCASLRQINPRKTK